MAKPLNQPAFDNRQHEVLQPNPGHVVTLGAMAFMLRSAAYMGDDAAQIQPLAL